MGQNNQDTTSEHAKVTKKESLMKISPGKSELLNISVDENRLKMAQKKMSLPKSACIGKRENKND